MTSSGGLAEAFHGYWKIIECINITSSRNLSPTKIEGAIFCLQENGEVVWDLPPDIDKSFPLFQCECYEITYPFIGASIQFGAVNGHMFEFSVDRPLPRDVMLLTFLGLCVLHCKQVEAPHVPLHFPYSLLPALAEGYFADLEIKNGEVRQICPDPALSTSFFSHEEKGVKIHSVVLKLSETSAEELALLPSDVLDVALHYLYSHSLPLTLTKDLATKCIQLAPPSISSDFSNLCRDFIHRTTLKEDILSLVGQVHSSAESISSSFSSSSLPSSFPLLIKNALTSSSLAFLKLLQLSVLYSTHAPTLDRCQRVEILRYAKSRLPLLLSQLTACLKRIKEEFGRLGTRERGELAGHLVPEIESLLGALSNLMREAHEAIGEIYSGSMCGGVYPCYGFKFWDDEPDKSAVERGHFSHNWKTESSAGNESVTESLFAIFREREVAKFMSLQKQIENFYTYIAQRKENFEEMSMVVKVRCVSRNLEQLLEELPVFLLRLEEIMIAFDDRFQWKDFKFCLQLAISQVCQTVHHLRKESDRLQQFFSCFSDLVQKDEFRQSLIDLKLLKSQYQFQPNEPSSPSAPQKNIENHDDSIHFTFKKLTASKIKNKRLVEETDVFENEDLDLIDTICTPAKSHLNHLAKNASKLFKSQKYSDMVFEVIQDGEKIKIPAHRVIVASRCDWFRRALMSGMKESIQKRVVIHDSSQQVIELFLEFIYTGKMCDNNFKTMETLSDLIILSDRYEVDSLKATCEQDLIIHYLDENSVIFLLSMADQYSARSLRAACMDFVARNPNIMARELFEELSPELQMEVYDITMWSKPSRKVFSHSDELLTFPKYMLVPDTSSSSSSSRPESPKNLDLPNEESSK